MNNMTTLKHIRNIKFFWCQKTKMIFQYTIKNGLERWSSQKYASANIAKSYLP